MLEGVLASEMRRALEGESLVSAFRHVNLHAGFNDLMIVPFAVIVFDNRRQKLLIMRRTYIS